MAGSSRGRRSISRTIAALPLADIAPTLDAVDAWDAGPGPYDEFSYERWSLAVVRAMCTVAREAGMGVLWANDLLFDADDADVP